MNKFSVEQSAVNHCVLAKVSINSTQDISPYFLGAVLMFFFTIGLVVSFMYLSRADPPVYQFVYIFSYE